MSHRPRPILRLPLLTLLPLLALLPACQLSNDNNDHLPPGQPFPSARLDELRPNMTYQEFETTFGPGWISHASTPPTAYWFFDDGHTIAVPPEVRTAPASPLQYRLIGPPLPKRDMK